jgi:putative adhesin
VPIPAHSTPHRRPSPWALLVAGSAVVVLGCALVLGVWWLQSSRKQIATYAVRGAVSQITLDLGGADATVVGGGSGRAVEVQRTDQYSFGRRAHANRDVSGGVLRLRSRCPDTVLASCSASYRVKVPDNIPVTVRTSSGDVRFSAYRGSASIATSTGNITVGGYCGFLLQARAETGDVRASTSCSPERLVLRSRSGDVRAIVPAGRYRVDADTDGGTRRVVGLTPAEDAPFQIQALSSAGDVDVETP